MYKCLAFGDPDCDSFSGGTKTWMDIWSKMSQKNLKYLSTKVLKSFEEQNTH